MSNWQIEKIQYENMFAYRGKGTIDFHKDCTYLIVGHNEDDEGTNSNGAGKSSVLDMISWGLFGYTPRNTVTKKAISRRAKFGSVHLTLSNETDTLEIFRCVGADKEKHRKYKKFTALLNGEDKGLRKTNKIIQQLIFDNLGFPSGKGEAWLNYISTVYFSDIATKGFLSKDSNPADRKSILEQYLKLNVWDAATKAAKLEAQELQEENAVAQYQVTEQNTRLKNMDSILELNTNKKDYEKQLNIFTEKRIKTKEELERITVLQDEYYRLKREETKLSSNLEMLEQQRKELGIRFSNTKLKCSKAITALTAWKETAKFYVEAEEKIRFNTKAFEKVDLELRTKMADLTSNVTTDTRLRKLRTKYSSQLDKIQTCPACKELLMVTREEIKVFDKNAIEKAVEEHDEAISSNNDTQLQLSNEVTLLKQKKLEVEKETVSLRKELLKYEKIKEEAENHSSVEAVLDQIREQALTLKERIQKVRTEHKTAQDKLDTYLLDNDITDISTTIRDGGETLSNLSENIATCQHTIDRINENIETRKKVEKSLKAANKIAAELKAKIEEAVYWKNTFPKLKSEILKQFIPLLELSCNRYLETLNVVQRVQFNLELETKEGDIRPGFEIWVYDGQDWETLNQYSGGETSRIFISIGYALNDLAATISPNRIGFLLVDELLDNLDETGIEYFFSLSNSNVGQKLIISHAKPNEIKSMADKVMLVSKKENVSTVKELSDG